MIPKNYKIDISAIKQYINNGISKHCAPSVSVGIFINDGTKYEISEGTHTYDLYSKKTEKDDIYDMASCTKIVATTFLVMKLFEENILDLDQPLIEIIPEFNNIQCSNDSWKRKITTRHLLSHTSGLPASVPGDDFPHNSTLEFRKEQIMKSTLIYEPGTQTVYSDLGFILLYIICEKLIKSNPDKIQQGKPEELEKIYFFDPLEMYDTCYNPLETKDKNRIIPTEKSDDAFPGEEFLCGVVHDEKARHVGGIDGHAGLFSTVPDLLKYIELFVRKGKFRGNQIFKTETIETFTNLCTIDSKSGRCLGFDKPTVFGGGYTSPSAFGHTGFTGTVIVIDPEFGFGHVILANAVHPNRRSREENGFFAFRDGLSTLIYEQLGFTRDAHGKGSE